MLELEACATTPSYDIVRDLRIAKGGGLNDLLGLGHLAVLVWEVVLVFPWMLEQVLCYCLVIYILLYR